MHIENVKKVKIIDRISIRISQFSAKWGVLFLRYSIGLIFIWFGGLKFFNLSPAEELVASTMNWIPPKVLIPTLALWEVIIGITMYIRPLLKVSIFLLLLQMVGTFFPLFVLPKVCFIDIPFVPTLEGQYIIKNIIIISAALVIGGSISPTKKNPKKSSS